MSSDAARAQLQRERETLSKAIAAQSEVVSMWPLMVLADSLTDPRIAEAGRYLINVDAAWRVCNEIGMPFYLLCAVLQKEGWLIGGKLGGHNIYGHDIGGVFRVEPPGYKYVTQANFEEFYRRVVVKGERSNGVGPMQITWPGFFPQMAAQGLRAWVPYENMLFGGGLFLGYYLEARNAGYSRREAIRRAGVRYNGSTEYGDRLLMLADVWVARVG